ncbi:MAG: hypothetical protein AB7V46_01185 [Thermomicrobiales bacterium]
MKRRNSANPAKRRLTVCAAFLLIVLSVAGSVVVAAQDLILSQESIEVEGMRPVGLSPDGQLLAATNFSMKSLCVYAVEPFAEQVCTSLEPLQAGLRIEDVAWSPDSTRLVMSERAFVYLRDGDLWVMDARSGDLDNITDDGYEGDFPLRSEPNGQTFSFDVSPAWTPDGQFITYSRSLWVDGVFTVNDIVTIPAGGGEPKSLVTIDEEQPGIAYLRMRWTSDGAALYYTLSGTSIEDPRNGIYRYDAASGSSDMVLGGSATTGGPAVVEVSPAGDYLLVWYPYLAGSYAGTDPLYWLLDPSSGVVQPLIPPEGAEGGIGFVGAATFAPDGRSVLLGTRLTDPNFQLWELDLASHDATLLVESLPGVMVMEYTLPPTWTSSGRIFVSSNIGSGTLLEVAPRNTPQIETAATPAAEISPDALVLKSGDMVTVSSEGVPLFSAPSATSQAVLLVGEGDHLIVLGQAQEGEGVLWLPVQDEETRTIGFVRVELLEVL